LSKDYRVEGPHFGSLSSHGGHPLMLSRLVYIGREGHPIRPQRNPAFLVCPSELDFFFTFDCYENDRKEQCLEEGHPRRDHSRFEAGERRVNGGREFRERRIKIEAPYVRVKAKDR